MEAHEIEEIELTSELENLKEENERLKMFLEHVGGALDLFDRDCCIAWASTASENRFGFAKVTPGQCCRDFPHRKPEDCDTCPLPKAFETGKIHTNIRTYTTSAGKTNCFRFTATPLLDVDGNANQVMLLAQDFSDWERTQDALIESEATARVLLDTTSDLAVLVDIDGTILAANEAALRTIGKSRDEYVGSYAFGHFVSDVAARRKAYFDKVVQSGEPLQYEQEVKGRIYISYLRPIKDVNGNVIRVATFAQDITDPRQYEIQLKKRTEMLEVQNRRVLESTRQKGRFFASMSHELRTPLTSIIGFTEILLEEDEPLTTQQRTLLSRISHNSERLLRMINDLLDLSRIESGRMTMNLTRVDLPSLMTQIVETMEPLVRDKSIELCSDVPEDLPLMRTDEQKLSQVLINLVSNAIKFTPEGKVTVCARLSENKICVSVSDTGIGIRRTDFGRIFEEFRQVENGNSRGGSGLGLAITRKLVHVLGGDIKVTSKLGEGSTFTVVLPVSLSQSLMDRRIRAVSDV